MLQDILLDTKGWNIRRGNNPDLHSGGVRF